MTPLELARSSVNCALALGTAGAQQVLRVLPADSEIGKSIRTSIYSATDAAQREFEQIAPLFFAYQVGYQAESSLADLAADAVRLAPLSPDYLLRVGFSLADAAEDAVKSLIPSESLRFYTQQCLNNFEVVGFVNQSDAPARLAPNGSYPLNEMVASCYAGNSPERDWPALWKVEGVGEKFGEAHLYAEPKPRDLLTSGVGLNQPEEAQLMLHSGIGIAFAKDIIRKITPWSSNTDIDKALTRFIGLCRTNSRKGYHGAALQSLGLVTRTWHRQMVGPVSTRLRKIDPLVCELFWRAAGGAMYFSPLNWMPGWSPWFSADTEPPDQVMRKNAKAGLSWPLTIVNMRQPGIMANFLRRKSNEIRDKDAFRNGVLSALIMATESVPGHYYAEKFAEFQPDDQAERDAWDKYIGTDLKARVETCRKVLKKNQRLDEIFHGQDLTELASSLR
jgi:hypothetical protein